MLPIDPQPEKRCAKRVQLVSLKMVREAPSLLYPQRKVTSPEDAYHLVSPLLAHKDREHFVVACLDTKHQPNALQIVSVGTLAASFAHPREVFKAAVLSNSASIICFHNHPSGDVEPSPEDIDVTKRLVESGKILGIEVLDHIIVGGPDRYRSLRESGLMST